MLCPHLISPTCSGDNALFDTVTIGTGIRDYVVEIGMARVCTRVFRPPLSPEDRVGGRLTCVFYMDALEQQMDDGVYR